MGTTTATKITYRKTKSGEWVAYGPSSAFVEPDGTPKATVEVTKKSGETKAEIISKLGKPFVIDGDTYVYGYLAPR